MPPFCLSLTLLNWSNLQATDVRFQSSFKILSMAIGHNFIHISSHFIVYHIYIMASILLCIYIYIYILFFVSTIQKQLAFNIFISSIYIHGLLFVIFCHLVVLNITNLMPHKCWPLTCAYWRLESPTKCLLISCMQCVTVLLCFYTWQSHLAIGWWGNGGRVKRPLFFQTSRQIFAKFYVSYVFISKNCIPFWFEVQIFNHYFVYIDWQNYKIEKKRLETLFSVFLFSLFFILFFVFPLTLQLNIPLEKSNCLD